jgi:hypothetical protein
MIANPIRSLISATCLCLSACVGSVDQLASKGSGEDKESEEPELAETCAKLSELRIGMATSQVLLACERRPRRTSDVITRDRKKVTVWIYGNGTFHMTDDKLVQIFASKQ